MRFFPSFPKKLRILHFSNISSDQDICHAVGMSYVFFNPNPKGRTVGDCSVRAVSKALDLSWSDAYLKIVTEGYGVCDMPSSDAVWGAVLRRNGFSRQAIPNTCPDCYTAEQFSEDNPQGTFVLGFGGHVATVVDGIIYDAWDSSNEIPIYVWTKER